MIINPLGPYLCIVTYICFACSPLDKRRIRLEYKQRMGQISWQDLRRQMITEVGIDNIEDLSLWWYLIHPWQLIKLCKRYHLAGNIFITWFILHQVLLFHLFLKTVFYTFIVVDKERKQYFSLIYPALLSQTPNPELFNPLVLTVTLFALSVRLRCAFRLIRSSIINALTYNELNISQINIGSCTVYELTLKDWYNFYNYSKEHAKTFSVAKKKHSQLNASIQDQLGYWTRRDLIFLVNCGKFSSSILSLTRLYQDKPKQLIIKITIINQKS